MKTVTGTITSILPHSGANPTPQWVQVKDDAGQYYMLRYGFDITGAILVGNKVRLRYVTTASSGLWKGEVI